MAKRKPVFTLAEMEKELGYKIEPLTRSNVDAKRFFSDLSPVSDGVYERTKREYEYLKYSKGLERMGCDILPDLGESKVSILFEFPFLDLTSFRLLRVAKAQSHLHKRAV